MVRSLTASHFIWGDIRARGKGGMHAQGACVLERACVLGGMHVLGGCMLGGVHDLARHARIHPPVDRILHRCL